MTDPIRPPPDATPAAPALPPPPTHSPRRRHRWLRRTAWIAGTLAALVGLYALAGFWALPRFGRAPLEQALTQALGAPVRIGAVTLDPFRLRVTATGVQADGTDGQPWLDVAALDAQACWCSLWGDAWVVRAVDITDPRVALTRNADGTLTLALPPADPDAPAGPPPAVRIGSVRLHGGALRYADQTLPAPGTAQLTDLTFTADALATTANAAAGTLTLSAGLAGGGRIEVSGTLGLAPLAAALDVQAHDVDVQAWRAWFPAGPAQAVRGGTLAAGAAVVYDTDGLRVREGRARVTGLALAAAGGDRGGAGAGAGVAETQAAAGAGAEPLARIGALEARGVDVVVATRAVQVGAVHAQDVSATLRRSADGRVDLVELLTAEAGTAGAVPAQPQARTAPAGSEAGTGTGAVPGPADPADPPPPSPEAAVSSASADAGTVPVDRAADTSRADTPDSNMPASVRDAPAGDVAGRAAGPASGTEAPADLLPAEPADAVTPSSTAAPATPESPDPAASPAAPPPTRPEPERSPAAATTGPGPAFGSAVPAPPPTPGPTPAWRVRVGEVQVNAGPLHWTDVGTAAPFTVTVESAQLRATGYDSAGTLPLPVALQASLAGGGTLAVQGAFSPAAPALEATVQAAGLPLPLAQPYVADAAHLDLRAGTLDADGTLHWAGADPQATRFAGSLTVRDLDLHDTRRNERLLGWQRLSVRTLEATPASARVGRMSLRGSYFRYRIGADGHSNLTGLSRGAPALASSADAGQAASTGQTAHSAAAPTAGPAAGSGVASAPAAPVYVVDIARLAVRDGTLDFADQTLPTPFAVTIEKLAGTLTALGNAPGTTTQGTLQGRVDGYAPATVEGRYTAGTSGPQAQFALRFRGLELATFSPYSGKFAGYRLRRGTLDVDLEYTVKNRALTGRNRFVLDQLELGERVESPEAVSLPLGLAIALLRDSRGVIDLQLPVSGDLGDPRFDYRALIGTALKRALTKVAKAPFAFLGSLVGGQKPPQSVLFPPGESALAERQTQALGLLAQALKDRSGVRVVISGAAGDADDARALAEGKLQALLATADEDDAPWDRLRALYRQRYDSKPEDDTPPAPDGTDRSRDDERAAAFAHARTRLLSDLAPDAAALEALAAARAQSVRTALAAAGVGEANLETGPARVIQEAADAPAVRTTLRLR